MKTVLGVVLATALVASGCGTDPGTGALRVRWAVGGTTCQSANIEDVVIHLTDGDVDILDPSRHYACDSGATGILLENLPTGSYALGIEGLDPDGNAFYSGALPDEVDVTGDWETVLPVINLELKKALILLNWEFKNGKLCSKNGVALVEVNVFDTTSNSVFKETYACDPFSDPDVAKDGGILIKGLRGNDDLSFDLFGLDASSARVFRGKAVIKTVPGGLKGGEPQELLITLSECVDPADCV